MLFLLHQLYQALLLLRQLLSIQLRLLRLQHCFRLHLRVQRLLLRQLLRRLLRLQRHRQLLPLLFLTDTAGGPLSACASE